MAYSDINSEDRLVQATFAEHLKDVLGWESVYAYHTETLGPDGTLGREDRREVVLKRDLRAAMVRLNSERLGITLRSGSATTRRTKAGWTRRCC
jgi:type I restriction enzyme R subunit